MTPITKLVRSLEHGLKRFVMRFGAPSRWSWGSSSRSRVDYAGTDPRSNSIVEAVVGTITRTFCDAPPHVLAVASDGEKTPVHAHPLTAKLRRPNPYYSGLLLWQATLGDWLTDGNAYWGKVRSADGRVTELWWLPASMVEPKSIDGDRRFVTHYEYRYDAAKAADVLRPEDVVHFRNGLDPLNPRKGLSPLKSLLREIFTDDEAGNYTAALLRNMGVPGVVISLDDGAGVTPAEAEQIKTDYEARFSGDNRGRVLVLATKAKVDALGISPQQMNLDQLRKVPEARIAARYGAAAMVVGLVVGLEHSIYANYAEAREALYESNIIPTQRLFAADLDTQLLPDFGDPERQEVGFDNADVRVLQPDLDKLYARLGLAVGSGWMMPNEARAEVGLDPLPGGDVIYLPSSLTPTDPVDLIPPEPEPAAQPPALDAPTPLQALPAPKGRRAFKSRHAVPVAEGLRRLRSRHQAPLEREIAAGLARERDEAVRLLHGAKDTRVLGEPGDWLRRVLEKWYRRVLASVQVATEDAIGVSFELDDPLTRAYLAEAGAHVRGITETTRRAVAAALQEGQSAGEGVPQLAARLRGLDAFSPARATLIARTELGHAANVAALTAYRASGVVVGVEVFDGHDDEPCASLAGRRLTLDEARALPPLGHPNCTRALGPITDPADLAGAA